MLAVILRVLGALVLLTPLARDARPVPSDSSLPPFGRDTVLVYKSSNENEVFVVRIAEFAPDRYMEWEDATAQGTIFIPAKVVAEGRALVNYQLFQPGVDTRGKDATTLWLSRRMFRKLKENQKPKLMIDGLPTLVTVLGSDQMAIEVNRSPRSVPVIKTRDERGAERWFLDLEDNPLLVNLLVRNYQQKLASITTDRPNTLRWIKGKKK
ncbi:MAG: hypothetical protein LAP85_17890 [Acidobacteriia bacterium]|nr:hypothetical protein [Terriglobia bacterium]